MDFVDRTILRLADPEVRAGLFDELSLEQIATAAYDTKSLGVEGPYTPVFEKLQLGFSLERTATIDGSWSPTGSPAPTRGSFIASGFGGGGGACGDAFWSGSIVASCIPADSRIIKVRSSWPTLKDIDALILADLGELPADAMALEQERRQRFIAAVRAALDQPQAFTQATLDRWLEQIGASSVSQFLEKRRSFTHMGPVTVTFSEPSAAGPMRKMLPISAVLLVRDVGFSVARLLTESKQLLDMMKSRGIEKSIDQSLLPRRSHIVVWIVPEQEFADPGWPGAEDVQASADQRKARRRKAGELLAAEGVGLAVLKD